MGSKLSNNQVLIIVILGAILFFVFILPMIDEKCRNENKEMKESLENTNNHGPKIDQSLCSRSCCKHAQWPLPEELMTKEIPEEQLSNYVGNNFSCNNGSGSGCLCLTKSQYDYLASRGNN